MAEENKEPILMAENKGEEGTANWSDPPYDLMELILEQLTKVPSKFADVSNYAHWAAVCVSWQQALDIYELYIHPQLPLLMIPGINNYNDAPSSSFNDEAVDGFCSFYRITDGKSLDQSQVMMPRNSYCRGSGHGWLIMVKDDVNKGFPVRLCNPFLSEEILLPSLKHLPVIIEHQGNEEDSEDHDPCDGYTYLHKAFLSADPLSYTDRYIVMAIYGNKFKRLAFLRSGDKAWNPIERNIRFEDVNLQGYQDSDGHLKRMFWAVTYKGDLVRFREADLLALNNEQPEMGQRVTVRGPPSIRTNKLYLVSTSKEIIFRWILVLRTIHIHDIDDDQAENETNRSMPYSTKEMKVFQIVSEEDHPSRYEWKEMDNLGGHTLLVGDNNSMFIDAAEYPGCKPDSIYYTDDYYLRYAKNHHKTVVVLMTWEFSMLKTVASRNIFFQIAATPCGQFLFGLNQV